MHLDIAERLISTGSELTRKMLKSESTELPKRNSTMPRFYYAPRIVSLTVHCNRFNAPNAEVYFLLSSLILAH